MEKEKKLFRAIAFIYYFTNLECKFYNNTQAKKMLFKLKQKQQIKMSYDKMISVKPTFLEYVRFLNNINNNNH